MAYRPVVYLAGPINGLTYEQAIAWREELRLLLPGFTILSPMRGKADLAGTGILKGPYGQSLLCRPEAIVMRDLTDVDRADLLIVNGLQGTLGTAIEVGYAVARQKPVVLIEPLESSLRLHPFARRLPRVILVETLADAAEFAHSLFSVEE